MAVPRYQRECLPLHGATSVAENAEVAGILRGAVHEHLDDSRAFLDWIIVGGESGPQARPMNPAWARSLRDQAANTGVAFLFKQWGERAPLIGVPLSVSRGVIHVGDELHLSLSVLRHADY